MLETWYCTSLDDHKPIDVVKSLLASTVTTAALGHDLVSSSVRHACIMRHHCMSMELVYLLSGIVRRSGRSRLLD